MSRKVFEPIVWGYVDASKTHGVGAEYYVAIGTEHWGYKDTTVLKIQMSYDRKRSGRKAVSFPKDISSIETLSDSSDDWNQVCEMVRKIENEFKNGKRGIIKTMAATDFCIICKKDFDKVVKPSKEHIIPEAFGNKSLVTWNVCVECNKKLGNKVDVHLTDFIISKFIRKEMLDKDLQIFPDTMLDDKGDRYRIREDGAKVISKVTDIDKEEGKISVSASTIEEGLKVASKKMKKVFNLSDEAVDEIVADPTRIKRLETQYFNVGTFKLDIELNLIMFRLAVIKIAYEYAIEKLGTEYFKDTDAETLRRYLADAINGQDFDENQCADINNRCHFADGFTGSIEDLCRRVPKEQSDKLFRYLIWIVRDKGNQLVCGIRILNSDALTFSVLLSRNADKYFEGSKRTIMTIITESGEIING